jgi:hypothetical protein
VRSMKVGPALRNSRLLGYAPRDFVEASIACTRVRCYDQGEVICRVGDLIPGPCWLEQGLISYHRTGDPGDHDLLMVGWPGQIAGPSWAPDRAEWPCSITALTPAVWAMQSREGYLDIRERFGYAFPLLVEYLAQETHDHLLWQSQLWRSRVRQRLRMALYRMAKELGTREAAGTLLGFRVTASLLTAIVGANRDEISRGIRELAAAGLVVRGPHWQLLVPNPERLVAGLAAEGG